MEVERERESERFEQESYVRPGSEARSGSGRAAGSLAFESGVLFEIRENNKIVLNDSLPQAEWYEIVEIAQSPSHPDEIWISVGGKELYFSDDGGRSFGRIKNVSYVSDISFVPVLHSDKHHALYLFGCLTDGRRGGFASTDYGKSWAAYDPERFIPFV